MYVSKEYIGVLMLTENVGMLLTVDIESYRIISAPAALLESDHMCTSGVKTMCGL